MLDDAPASEDAEAPKRAPQRTIAEVKAAFEARFAQVVDLVHTNDSHAPNDRRFSKHFTGAPNWKGKLKLPAFETAPTEQWLREALELAKLSPDGDDKGAVLFWRINPHVIAVPGGVTVYACFATGDEPHVPEPE